eukprot:TRINITY_DN1756_c0_g1_i1.p5 TRINITY_DN1756_c0_g1~~TRINITY_DN1756_c0_g1_i1.p5  ORF type:complete len:133 (-),score=6.30 TRINITY_DN1756_c0_g1_i1:606-1004(-)
MVWLRQDAVHPTSGCCAPRCAGSPRRAGCRAPLAPTRRIIPTRRMPCASLSARIPSAGSLVPREQSPTTPRRVSRRSAAVAVAVASVCVMCAFVCPRPYTTRFLFSVSAFALRPPQLRDDRPIGQRVGCVRA